MLSARLPARLLAVLALAEHGGFLNAPDTYMDKIAVGGGLPEGASSCCLAINYMSDSNPKVTTRAFSLSCTDEFVAKTAAAGCRTGRISKFCLATSLTLQGAFE